MDLCLHDVGRWDLAICHPPCTDLAVSGARWFPEKQRDFRQQKSIVFFMLMFMANADRIAVENPVCIMSKCYRKPDQIIQPYEYGHPYIKTTCLWLVSLPKLNPTRILSKPENGWVNQSFKPDGKYGGFNGKFIGSKERSKTFQGIADAMAEQWGSLGRRKE